MEKRIRKHFSREMEKIKKLILSLGTMVEERVRIATKAIEDNDAILAQHRLHVQFRIEFCHYWHCALSLSLAPPRTSS